MLKRIFFRSRKGSKKSRHKKMKKSKSNQLNISTDETNLNTYSFIESGNDLDNKEDEDDID